VVKIADKNVVQGHELQMATNSLAPYLLTTLLEPILIRTAVSSPPFSVRVVFVSALMNHRVPAGGISFDSHGSPKIMPEDWDNYMQSKVGGTWLADGFAKRLGSKDILSVVSPSDDSE
jgi:retinol dehydrogenase 12